MCNDGGRTRDHVRERPARVVLALIGGPGEQLHLGRRVGADQGQNDWLVP